LRQPPERLFRAIGFSFIDPRLAERALRHRSAGHDNNERLEFLGDALLGMVIAEALFRAFPEADEGQLSRLRASLVKRESLARIAGQIDLGDYLELGAGELRSGGQSRGSILADGLEALLAAVYLDGGMAPAAELIQRLFRERLEGLSPELHGKDPKTRLQEHLQARRMELPDYEVIGVQGEQHRQMFRVRCRVGTLATDVEAMGSSRRKAEQAAALKVLQALGEETPVG